ncbi:MAG: UvrD-helicase domain-containing protein [Nitrospirales bacterium]|nr:UvrD-helicase domain-containing protein [Nitrospira sp.]MDR4503067.1 UvrD-helicase domain-containing protein [Nitrospirales bacterium]
MSESFDLSDSDVRRLAVSNFDQNVVVIAGAGTGKTTLLVHRFLSTLFREPEAISITKIVALTFTNKAALEMKVRIQAQLRELSNDHQNGEFRHTARSRHPAGWLTDVSLSNHEIQSRARSALADFEKAQIGTLHSFAAHLLRLYPLESGVPPNFQEDDGTRFTEYFTQEWEAWVGDELSSDGGQHERWRVLLAHLRLPVIRDFAYTLSLDLPSIDLVPSLSMSSGLPENLKGWCSTMRHRAQTLLSLYGGPKRRKIENALADTETVLTALLENGVEGLSSLTDEHGLMFHDGELRLGKMPAGWTEEHFSEAKGLIRVANALVNVEHRVMASLLEVLSPFVRRIHHGFVQSGWVTFQGLLNRARSLLRDYPVVRERLKLDYQAILVDEFQDTDPLQYEMVMFLGEQRGQHARDWRDIRLSPGKLFIVGDPKQSIYAFRGADLEAFDHIVEKIVKSHGVVYELTTNFRSHSSILHVVNAVFEELFWPRPHVQPRHIPLSAPPQRPPGMKRVGVELRLVRPDEDDEEDGSMAMTRHEADHLARWIKDELLRGDLVDERTGQNVPLRPGHIGLLFRTLTASRIYLEALQRYDLPYISEGEKHFYQRQEVIDFVNLLRVLDHPGDEVAMFGLLRSALGGLSDHEIYELRRLHAFDCRNASRLAGWSNPKRDILKRLYAALTGLHVETFLYPLGTIIERIFARLPVRELALASAHGEQAVANLVKVQKIAVSMADRPILTFRGFVNLLAERIRMQHTDAEQTLEEDSLDAIRVLTVHKAKGLEFPIVIVPGLHQGARRGGDGPVVSWDWATEIAGASVGSCSTVGGIFLKEKARIKELAEQSRLLYVAMTRAQERLILSGACPKRQASGTFFRLLEAAASQPIGSLESGEVLFGSTAIPLSLLEVSEHSRAQAGQAVSAKTTAIDLSCWKTSWETRDRIWNILKATPTSMTPTSLTLKRRTVPLQNGQAETSRQKGIQVGVLAHRILERWNFSQDSNRLENHIASLCRQGLQREKNEVRENIRQDLTDLFKKFMASSIYQRLERSTIIGREVPFTIPWDCLQDSGIAINEIQGVMEGVIDLVYEYEGQTWILDYKTDRIEEKEISDRMHSYRTQAKIYQQAVRYCLGLQDVKCQLLFVRLGQAVEI